MKIPKDKLDVRIVIYGDALIQGTIHLNPGERMQDFINDKDRDFIAVTDVEFHGPRKINFRSSKIMKRQNIILSKSAIKWLEEV